MKETLVKTPSTYYLILRPLSEDIREAEEYIEGLKDVTGLDHLTLHLRITGTSPRILKAGSDETLLLDMARDIRRDSLRCAVLRKDEIKAAPTALKATSLDSSTKTLRLLGKAGEPLITVNSTSKLLIVLATTDVEGLNSKRLSKKTLNKVAYLTKEETLQFIFRHKPVMDIYTNGSEVPVRVYGERFNFSTLGDKMRETVSLNFETLLKEIGECAGSSIIETGFGETQLPFLSLMKGLSTERKLRNFNSYSRFIYLLEKDGLYKTAEPGTDGLLLTLPVFSELGEMLWGGPFNPLTTGGRRRGDGEEYEESPASSEAVLPPPPDDLRKSSSRGLLRLPFALFSNFTASYRRLVRSLGPAVIFYPLTAVLIISLLSIYLVKHYAPLAVSLTTLGAILFSHSFVALKRKRVIENCPTSKLRSMPMGEVEITGRARAKHYLTAPYSMTQCVYYSYKIYERVHTKNGETEALTEWGESGPVPFYLEEKEVRVTVMPENAILRAGRSETFRGATLGLTIPSHSGSGRKIIETIIPVGEKLYILGYAYRVIEESGHKSKKITEKLRELKGDEHLLMKHYDMDRNGKIDSEEWDRARSDVEREVLRERLSKESSVSVAIGEHPSGGLFYISDREEKDIIKRLSWKTTGSFILGVSSFACGFYYLLKILGNKDIIYMLIERLNNFPA